MVRGTGAGRWRTCCFGDPAVAGSGDGTLLRASGSTGGSIVRRSVSNSTAPHMTIGAGCHDRRREHHPRLDLCHEPRSARRARCRRGGAQQWPDHDRVGQRRRVAPPSAWSWLGLALDSLQTSARRLSLLSYSSLDIYGTGTLGSRDAFDLLTLSASTLRGYNAGGGTATLAARNILIDNATGRPAWRCRAGPLDGTLLFQADESRSAPTPFRPAGIPRWASNAADRVLASAPADFSRRATCASNRRC